MDESVITAYFEDSPRVILNLKTTADYPTIEEFTS
jgi:hypothetical protein